MHAARTSHLTFGEKIFFQLQIGRSGGVRVSSCSCARCRLLYAASIVVETNVVRRAFRASRTEQVYERQKRVSLATRHC